MVKRLKVWMGLIVVMAVIAFCPKTKASAEMITVGVEVSYHQEEMRALLEEINAYRTSGAGWYWCSNNVDKYYTGVLQPLTYDYDLEKVAMQRAAELVIQYSHARPNFTGCFGAYDEAGYDYRQAGENIAAGFETAESVYIAWLEENKNYNGQGHRRAILSSDYTAIGMAYVECNGWKFYVQEFSDANRNDVRTIISTEPVVVSVECDPDCILIDKCVIDNDCVKNTGKWIDNNYTYVSRVNAGDRLSLSDIKYYVYYDAGDYTWNDAIIKLDNLSWSSSDTAVASISGDTLLINGCGKATLTADFYDTTAILNLEVQHNYDEKVEPATTSKDGVKSSECIYCHTTKSDTVIKKIGRCKLNNTVFVYNGKAKKPAVTVYASDGSFISSDNYDVKYANNKKVGTATATITFKGDYKGTVELEFVINPKTTTIKSISTSGKVVVKWKKLSAQCDGYQLEYANNSKFTLNEGISTIAGIDSANKTMLFTKRNGKRYLRIRTYKVVNGKTYYSAWSKTYEYNY